METFPARAMRRAAVCLVFLLAVFAARVEAAPISATVAWNPNTEPNIASYTLMYGTQSGIYTTTLSAGNATSLTVSLPGPAVYFFVVRAVNTSGVSSSNSVELRADLSVPPPPPNFLDSDGKADLAVWRPSNGTWFSLRSGSSFNYATSGMVQWGNQASGDVPFMGDIDGDGATDLIVWRSSTGMWYWLTSSTGYAYASAGSKQWGSAALGDVPMIADIDGDKKSDLIVWRPTDGTWYWLKSTTGYNYASQGQKQWGSKAAGDMPMTGDVDGDGKADLIVWRTSTSTFYWVTSSSSYNSAAAGTKQWGSSALGDVPLIADMDGDGKSDLVVWRSSDGTWYWLKSTNGYSYTGYGAKQWGSKQAGDIPLLADVDGDGKADPIVWREPIGTFYWLTSLSGYNYQNAGSKAWGTLGDIPKVK